MSIRIRASFCLGCFVEAIGALKTGVVGTGADSTGHASLGALLQLSHLVRDQSGAVEELWVWRA